MIKHKSAHSNQLKQSSFEMNKEAESSVGTCPQNWIKKQDFAAKNIFFIQA